MHSKILVTNKIIIFFLHYDNKNGIFHNSVSKHFQALWDSSGVGDKKMVLFLFKSVYNQHNNLSEKLNKTWMNMILGIS